MNRQPLRTLSIVLFPLVVAMLGCAEEESIGLADESTETGDDESSEANGPTIEITVNGDSLPPTIRSAARLHVRAEADDPSGVSFVEFYLDDQLLESDALEPYTTNLFVSDQSFNGERSLTVRAYNSSGNVAESSIPLSIALPDAGTVEWEYIGAGESPRWVFVGPKHSALVIDAQSMLQISTEGELLSTYEFPYEVSAATVDEDGSLITLGAVDGTLMIQRFSEEGVPLFFDLVVDFGAPDMTVTDVALGDGRLVISSVNPHDVLMLPTARVSSVAYGNEATLEWHHDLLRDGQPSDVSRPTRVAVAPGGAIYATATFAADQLDVHLQLRRIEPNGEAGPINESLINYRTHLNDIVATDEGVFVAARMNDVALIERFDFDTDEEGLFYVDDEALTLEVMGDALVYGSVMPDKSMKIGRMSLDGAKPWTTELGGGDLVQDIAVTSVGHMYVVSEWAQNAWRLRRVHP